ncbi:MAG: carotenoid biosynthesis protein [Cryomorphaceae bacterium]|nr:carotenoid biosynthesis protein [Cryomorphaceae bacterium]
MKNLTRQQLKLGILIILHLVGLIGLSIEMFRSLFVGLSSVNLLLTAAMIFDELQNPDESDRLRVGETKDENWLRPFVALSGLFVAGMGIEILGVQTGFPFGEYQYGTVLGPRIAGVSVIIGLNWFYLVVCAVAVTRYLTKNKWLTLLIAPAILTGLDFLIEPVAISMEYWAWVETTVPLSNYFAWFIVSIPMVLFYLKMAPVIPVKFPAQVLALQTVFFVVLNFLI